MIAQIGRFARALARIGAAAATSFAGNLSLLGLSVGLALSLWLFVTDQENPTRTETFNRPIPLRIVNVPDNLAVANTSETSVTVRIEGPQSELDDLSADDFEATANLGGFAAGQSQATIEVTSENRRVDVIRVEPRQVAITLEPLRSRDVPVVVSLFGSPERGFEAVQTLANPDRVTITGPESLVDLVDAAFAEVDLTGLSVDIDRENVPLDLRDARGGDISGVNSEPAIASVSVDLLQKEYSLAFVVSPTIRGEPATGYNVTGIAIDPRLVIISGPLDVLQSIDAVRGIATAEISIADSRGDVSRVVRLTLPEGARVQGSADVSVRVSIAPAKGEFTFRVVPLVRNIGSGLVASQPEPVSVTLAGDVPALEALTATSISLTADAQGLAAGLHALPLQIEPPNGTTLVRIDPAEVGIALSAR